MQMRKLRLKDAKLSGLEIQLLLKKIVHFVFLHYYNAAFHFGPWTVLECF